MKRKVRIILHKTPILDFVDGATYKRVDASMADGSQRSQDAVASDSEDVSDFFLLNEYCNRRDAMLRKRLAFCLEKEEEANCNVLVFDNSAPETDEYTYSLLMEDGVDRNLVGSIGKMMDSYIKRGAIFSWYRDMGIQPTDTEAEIQALEDEIVYALRGQAWGHRPMQPFGPAFYSFSQKQK